MGEVPLIIGLKIVVSNENGQNSKYIYFSLFSLRKKQPMKVSCIKTTSIRHDNVELHQVRRSNDVS